MMRFFVDQRWVFRILRHVLLFLSLVIIFSWVAYYRADDEGGYLGRLLVVLINAIFFFAYAYLTVYVLIPQLLARKKIGWFVLLFLVSGLALSVLKYLFSDFGFYQAISPESGIISSPVSLSRLLVNTKDMTFIVALFAIVKYARDHYLLESNIREMQQKGLEAEIKLLEHHMDPHVIFNNFNSLYSISLNRPELLSGTVKKLKSVLHYLFRESKHEKVSLSREIEMIENYIGLEALRYGDRLKIKYEMDGNPEGLKITPLILYPFVENCFVHGAGEDPDRSWIEISLIVNDTDLHFIASNSVSHRMQNSSGGGVSANENSIRRLEIQYPNSHRLAILDREKRHEVKLNIRLSR
ncbi:MAG: histidine kinase [Bacteroides sp.]|nr:histidine kinase [Bacteroides sp.]